MIIYQRIESIQLFEEFDLKQLGVQKLQDNYYPAFGSFLSCFPDVFEG